MPGGPIPRALLRLTADRASTQNAPTLHLIDIHVSIYLASKTRWTHLQKVVQLPAVPRVGEWLKLRNDEMGDYFGWRVSEVTYRESGQVEVMTELLEDIGGRGYSFEDEAEFDDYYRSYLECGWAGDVTRNRRHRGDQGAR